MCWVWYIFGQRKPPIQVHYNTPKQLCLVVSFNPTNVMMKCIIDTRANHTIGFDLQARALQHGSHARRPTIPSEPSDRRDNAAAVLLLSTVTHAGLTLP